MTPIAQLDSEFAFKGAETDEAQALVTPTTDDALGPLAELVGPGDQPGVWAGHGFNLIWHPHRASTGQDRFLELNLTDDRITFTRINGEIPNRGLAMGDINLVGLSYMQQINETGQPSDGLHVEPGIWATVPHTTDPAEPPTVVRMASIPHGTVVLAQGIARSIDGGRLEIPDTNAFPFFFGQPAPGNGAFHSVAQNFPEIDLSIKTRFRQTPAGVDQAMVTNPNTVLQDALAHTLQGRELTRRTFLHVSTTGQLVKGGGGTANTAFLASSHNPSGGNARAATVEATVWIQTFTADDGQEMHQLQYTQLVMLDFNGIHWPHVTVGTLVKQ